MGGEQGPAGPHVALASHPQHPHGDTEAAPWGPDPKPPARSSALSPCTGPEGPPPWCFVNERSGAHAGGRGARPAPWSPVVPRGPPRSVRLRQWGAQTGCCPRPAPGREGAGARAGCRGRALHGTAPVSLGTVRRGSRQYARLDGRGGLGSPAGGAASALPPFPTGLGAAPHWAQITPKSQIIGESSPMQMKR